MASSMEESWVQQGLRAPHLGQGEADSEEATAYRQALVRKLRTSSSTSSLLSIGSDSTHEGDASSQSSDESQDEEEEAVSMQVSVKKAAVAENDATGAAAKMAVEDAVVAWRRVAEAAAAQRNSDQDTAAEERVREAARIMIALPALAKKTREDAVRAWRRSSEAAAAQRRSEEDAAVEKRTREAALIMSAVPALAKKMAELTSQTRWFDIGDSEQDSVDVGGGIEELYKEAFADPLVATVTPPTSLAQYFYVGDLVSEQDPVEVGEGIDELYEKAFGQSRQCQFGGLRNVGALTWANAWWLQEEVVASDL